MSETKPTAGALRAAGSIMTAIGDSFRVIPFETLTTEKAAQIIDREMAGPEIKALLVAVLEYIVYANKPPWEAGRFDNDAWLKRLETATRALESALVGKAETPDLEAHERDLERRAGCEFE